MEIKRVKHANLHFESNDDTTRKGFKTCWARALYINNNIDAINNNIYVGVYVGAHVLFIVKKIIKVAPVLVMNISRMNIKI